MMSTIPRNSIGSLQPDLENEEIKLIRVMDEGDS
jgi:hypothetical protein